MKNEKTYATFYRQMLSSSRYRTSHGQLIRRLVLLVAVSCFLLLGHFVFSQLMSPLGGGYSFLISLVIACVGSWAAHRVLQHQQIAEFLIDVQTESAKVTWCTFSELRRTTAIVLSVMVVFSGYLFACDVFWQLLLRLLAVLNV